MNKNKKIIIISSLALIAVLVVAGLSYALFSERLTGETNYVINAGDLKVKLDESKNLSDILQENNIPISDAEGKDLDGYKFSLINNENKPLSYTIYIVEDTVTNKTPSNDIKMYYTRDYGNISEMRLLSETNNSENKLVETGTIPANTTFNYDLKLWLDKNAGNEILGTSYSCHIEVVATQVIEEYYVESILNGTEPVLTDNLVPVTIEDDGTVLKADLTKNWYSYENKEWANAIVLKDQTETYNVNQEIPEDKIESYFVWIPKYSYQLWDLGNYNSLTSNGNKQQEIKIRFGTTNTNNTNTNECVTPEVAGETGKCIVGDYMTHPAFLAFEGATGFWTGKFETGFSETTAPTSSTGLSTDTSKIIIKPNVYSWRYNTLGNFFKLGYDYIREDESHMMKNTEWGAVAYLSHSKYGSMSSVRINNNSNYITGYAATEEPTKGYNSETSIAENRNEGTSLSVDGTYTVNYLNTASTVASTTSNYSGVYDMSGGNFENVMGYTASSSIGVGGTSEITSVYSDFFTNSKWNKYYDMYNTSAVYTDYLNRVLGDATGEMGPFFSELDLDDAYRYRTSWYKDYAHFIISDSPWFNRGGTWYDGVSTGLFSFACSHGGSAINLGFRIVLTPTK